MKQTPYHIDGKPFRDLSFGISGSADLDDETEAALKKDISLVASYAEITKSNIDDRTQLRIVHAKSRIRKYGPSLFARAFQDEWQAQIFSDDTLGKFHIDYQEKTVREVTDILSKTQIPELRSASAEALEKAMLTMYNRMASVSGALTDLVPALKDLTDLEKRMVKVVKAIHGGNSEWRGDAISQLWIPSALVLKRVAVERAVAALKLRYTGLSNAYDIASRLVTLESGAPTGTISLQRKQQFLDRQLDDDYTPTELGDDEEEMPKYPKRSNRTRRPQPKQTKSALGGLVKPSSSKKKGR